MCPLQCKLPHALLTSKRLSVNVHDSCGMNATCRLLSAARLTHNRRLHRRPGSDEDTAAGNQHYSKHDALAPLHLCPTGESQVPSGGGHSCHSRRLPQPDRALAARGVGAADRRRHL